MIRLTDIKVPISEASSLEEIAAGVLKVSAENIKNLKIIKKAVDARRYIGSPIVFIYTLDVTLNVNEKKILEKFKRDTYIYCVVQCRKRGFV